MGVETRWGKQRPTEARSFMRTLLSPHLWPKHWTSSLSEWAMWRCWWIPVFLYWGATGGQEPAISAAPQLKSHGVLRVQKLHRYLWHKWTDQWVIAGHNQNLYSNWAIVFGLEASHIWTESIMAQGEILGFKGKKKRRKDAQSLC